MFKPTHTPLAPDGEQPIERLTRFGGYELTEFQWNERDGRAHFTYERKALLVTAGKKPEPVLDVSECEREQPAGRRHVGWRWHNGRYTTEPRT